MTNHTRRHPWSTYAVFQTTLTQWSFAWDACLTYLLWFSTQDWPAVARQQAFIWWTLWLVFSKTIKLMGHLVRYPEDFLMLPVSFVFGWLHGFIKLWAGLTMHVVSASSVSRFLRVTWKTRVIGYWRSS